MIFLLSIVFFSSNLEPNTMNRLQGKYGNIALDLIQQYHVYNAINL